MGGPDGKPYALTAIQILLVWPDRSRSVSNADFFLVWAFKPGREGEGEEGGGGLR